MRHATLAMLMIAAPLAPVPAGAQTPLTLAQARAGLAGRWEGKLEYRDYQSNRWYGIPFTATIRLSGDGLTLVQETLYDDGPGKPVWITSLALLDAAAGIEWSTSFRAAEAPELESATVTLASASDATHWTMVATLDARDDDRPAHLRETTTRDGDTLTTLKEIDFADDADEAWIVRNRSSRKRLGDAPAAP